ncbi:MAG: hypothetical protein ACYTAF_09955 [Planctomycetota bacterium]|jgi:DNA-binding LacI/PurR family transcriptional regulator
MVTINEVAKACGIDPDIVRDVLKELPGAKVPMKVRDKVFQTARKLGYDLKKLKLAKQMDLRKKTVRELLSKIGEHPNWDRDQIVEYLQSLTDMVERVHKRSFPEEYGKDKKK